VLVVGLDGIGKRKLAQVLVECSKEKQVELDVFVANQLPLSDPITDRIDYIVCMVDMKSMLSLERLQESVTSMDREYALARSCLLVVNAETPANHSFSLDEAEAFAKNYGMCRLYCTLEDTSSLAASAASLLVKIVNTTRANGLSPLFLSTLDFDIVSATTL